VKLEVLRLLVALTINWRKLVQPHMPALLQHCWAMFSSCLPLYQQAVVLAQEEIDEGGVRWLSGSQATMTLCSQAQLSLREIVLI
jgi:hypothetical protein